MTDLATEIQPAVDSLKSLSSSGIAGDALVLLTALLVAAAGWLLVKKVLWKKRESITNYLRSIWALTSMSFRGLFEMLFYVFTSREWRYRSPWVLMLHSPQADNKVLGQCLEKNLGRNVTYQEKRLTIEGTQWYFLNNGIVIDPEADPDHEADSLENIQWHTTLASISQQRSEKPVDSVLLVVSLKELEKDVNHISNRFFQQLYDVQKCFSFVLPVYVLITDCDEVEGFSDFWAMQDELSYDQMFGWSSPYKMSSAFSVKWFDECFSYIRSCLRRIQLSTSQAKEMPVNSDGYFLFPSTFSRYEKSIRELLQKVFEPGKYHTDFVFRGLYFSGNVKAGSDASFHDEEGNTPGFVNELMDKKIFSELNLARPTHNGFLSRDNTIRRFQIGVMATFTFLFLSLFVTNYLLDRQINTIVSVIQHVDRWDKSSLSQCQQSSPPEEIYSLLGDVATIDRVPSYWNLPFSWGALNNSPQRIASHLSEDAFGEIVFPNINCYMQDKAEEVANINNLDPALSPGEKLKTYVDDVLEYDKNLALFDRVAPRQPKVSVVEDVKNIFSRIGGAITGLFSWLISQVSDNSNSAVADAQAGSSQSSTAQLSTMEAFIALNEYLFSMKVPSVLHNNSGQHQTALRKVAYTPRWVEYTEVNFKEKDYPLCMDKITQPPLSKTPQRPVTYQYIAQNICVLSEDVRQTIESRSLLQNYNFAVQVDTKRKLEQAIIEQPQTSLQAINGWIAYVTDNWIDSKGSLGPCERADNEIIEYQNSLQGNYPYPDKLFEPITALFSDKNCHSPYMAGITAQQIPPYTQVFSLSETDTNSAGKQKLIFSDDFSGEQKRLKNLADRPFMQAKPASAFVCETKATQWSGSVVNQAIALYNDYENYLDANDLAGVATKDSLAANLAWNQLRQAINYSLNSAQLNTNAKASGSTTSGSYEATIAEESKQFDQVKSDLLQLLTVLRQLEMQSTYTALTQCSRRSAISILNDIDTLTSGIRLYQKVPGKFYGYAPFADYQFQITSKTDLSKYINDQHKRIAILAGYLQPPVTYLMNTDSIESSTWYDDDLEINFWGNTLGEFNKFTLGVDQSNQLQLLDDYLETMLSDVDLSDCGNKSNTAPSDFGNDLFSLKRFELESKVGVSCSESLTTTVEEQYAEISKVFNEQIAGRYPFVGNGKLSNNDIAPDVVASFLSQYGENVSTLAEKTAFLAKSAPDKWSKVAEFLADLDSLSKFFSTNLLVTPNPEPLQLAVKFDLDVGQAPNSLLDRQTSVWQISSDTADVTNTMSTNLMLWRYDEALNVTINWSGNADYLPDAGKKNTDGSKYMQYDEAKNWALFKLLDQYPAQSLNPKTLTSYGENILEFNVEVSPLAKTSDKPDSQTGGTAKLFMSVTAYVKDSKTKAYVPVVLPQSFPAIAPSIKQE